MGIFECSCGIRFANTVHHQLHKEDCQHDKDLRRRSSRPRKSTEKYDSYKQSLSKGEEVSKIRTELEAENGGEKKIDKGNREKLEGRDKIPEVGNQVPDVGDKNPEVVDQRAEGGVEKKEAEEREIRGEEKGEEKKVVNGKEVIENKDGKNVKNNIKKEIRKSEIKESS